MAHDPLDLTGIEDELHEDERLVRDSVSRFVDAEVLPDIGRHFADHHFPRELVLPLARLGLLGSSIEGYGCAGLNAVCYGLICQQLERGDSALRSFVSVQSSLCMYPIHAYGSEAQRERWLPAMARGEAIGCFGLTESHGGSDPLNMSTTARQRGSDWVLNGSKMWITNAPIADVAVVWALTDEGVRGFLVERGMKGFSTQEIERKMSLRASATGALFFDDVVLPQESLLPGSSVGLKAPLSCLTQARFGIAWGVLGAAQACLSEALHYTRERVLFGRPLAATQAVAARTVNSGQSCIAAKRFIVCDAVYDAFLERFVSGMRALRVGDPREEATQIGPIATESVRDGLARQVSDSIAAGARVLLGGSTDGLAGFFYPPTVLVDIPDDAPAAREELFGPVASVFRVADVAAAIAKANDTPFGLGASVWTRDPALATQCIEGLEVGMVFVNEMVVSDPRYPFGGVKQSGMGRELGPLGFREFTNPKAIRRSRLRESPR